jgi:hypothetical protein
MTGSGIIFPSTGKLIAAVGLLLVACLLCGGNVSAKQGAD